MTSDTKIAQDAIARSISHDEIVTIPFDPDAWDDLIADCEDWAVHDRIFDVWGQTEDGESWRVYMTFPDDTYFERVLHAGGNDEWLRDAVYAVIIDTMHKRL